MASRCWHPSLDFRVQGSTVRGHCRSLALLVPRSYGFWVLLQGIDAIFAPRRMAQASSWTFFFLCRFPGWGLRGPCWLHVGGPGIHLGSCLGLLAPSRGLSDHLTSKWLGGVGSMLAKSRYVLAQFRRVSTHYGSKLWVLGPMLAPGRGCWLQDTLGCFGFILCPGVCARAHIDSRIGVF